MDATSEMRQGFICPFCFDDLGDVQHLQAHVDRFHGESTGSDAFEQVKGLFGKAKERLRQFEVTPSLNAVLDLPRLSDVAASAAGSGSGSRSVPNSAQPQQPGTSAPPLPAPVQRWSPPPSTIGVRRSHKEAFLKWRDTCVSESEVTTNKLIIRLDKLVNQCPADPTKRKEFEREVVPWGPDAESASCTTCSAKFSITRRRHHCRLCGCVMCNACSRSLSFVTARTLTNPATETAALLEAARSPSPVGFEGKLEEVGERLVGIGKRTGAMLARLNGRDGGEVSLASLLQQDAEERLRVCASCLGFLERRAARMEANEPPALASLYERLTELLSNIANLVPSYGRMAESLSNGETLYTLESAESIRGKLLKTQREIDILRCSRNLVTMCFSKGIAECDDVKSPKEQQLRRNIRYVAVSTLQEVVARTPSLPTPEVCAKLVEEHKNRIQRQVEESRARMADLRLRQSPSSPTFEDGYGLPPNTSNQTKPRPTSLRTSASFGALRSTDEGWRPDSTASSNPFADDLDEENPLQQQIRIIKGYLKQAAEAGRLEEVEMLERNLRDLYEENKRLGLETPRC